MRFGFKIVYSPRVLADKLREKGLLWCLKTGAVVYFGVIFFLPLKLCQLILRYPLYYMGVRFINMPFWTIGHFATDPDCFIKEKILGMRPKFFEIWLVYPKERVANQCLLDYWRKHIRIIDSSFWYILLEPLSRDSILEYKGVHEYTNTYNTAQYTVIHKAWGNRPPILSLSQMDRERGWENLRRLGVPRDAWFVTVHCREPGFYKILHPNFGDMHDFRDADIYSYIPAMKAIVECGGWCIRVGDPTMKPLPQMENVIDYVHLDIKSDWMDIFLLANCKFHLGGSGVFGVCCAFGIPNAMANVAPIGTMFQLGPRDIDIPKLVWSFAEGRLLTFKEILDSSIGNFYYTHLYNEANVRVVDNSPEDIRGLALEMLDRIEGKAVYTVEDERLQEQFKALFRPGHRSYGGSSRIGRDFLRKYAVLLGEEIQVGIGNSSG